MKDFLTFRKMLAPFLIQVIFWLTLIFCLVAGIKDLFLGQVRLGLEVLILGPLIARITCELLILAFRINDNIEALRKQ